MSNNRRMTPEEERLLRWMLAHGGERVDALLPQVDRAMVTPVRCPCGCATFDLQIDGHELPTEGMSVVADFWFTEGDDVSGIFVFEMQGLLAGVEVYGLSGDPPRELPPPEILKPMDPPVVS